MDSNIEIINIVLANLHSGIGLRSLASLFSPSFTYESPMRGSLNFEQQCSHLTAISNNCQFDVKSIINVECCYEIELDLVIIDRAEKEYSRLPAKANVFFENELIESITTSYEATPKQLEYIKKYLALLTGKP